MTATRTNLLVGAVIALWLACAIAVTAGMSAPWLVFLFGPNGAYMAAFH